MDQVNNDLCLNETLRHIEEKIIRISGKKLSDFGMPTPQRRGELSTDFIKELSYNTTLLDTQVSETKPCLLPEQKDISNKILRVELGEGGLFFLDTPGGIVKTCLLNLLLAKIQIGEVHLDTDQEGMVLFTHQFCHVVESEDELIDQVFFNLQQYILDEKWKCERTILAPKMTIAKINKKILGGIASETSVYNSIDTVMASDDTTNYLVEFRSSLEISGVPSHKLELKKGVSVLLMRNLDAPRLCNGTRLRIAEQ
ncbi:ATP-dependent DNA helicase [Trichonephila clavipes]|nr:ATP-dependent DNA helicase [Trichonephila clavipes]